MKTYIAQIINPHGNGYAIVNASNPKSVEDIIRNQSRFHNSIVASCKELVWKDADDSIIYEGAIVTLGKSAYDLAVLTGYKGTLEEWLSSMKGVAGDDGNDGVSVQDVTLNPDNSFTFLMSNGSTITTDSIYIEGGGEGGQDGVGIQSIQTIQSTQESGGANIIRITLTNGNTFDFNVYNGAKGDDGVNGNDGITPTITATASVDNTTGTPNVTVANTGDVAHPSFAFSFSGIKGEQGLRGIQGEHGLQGEKGDKGDKGDKGNPGTTDYNELINKPVFAAVATTGSYNDLKDKPNIPVVPTNVSVFNNDAGYLTQHQDISGKAEKSEMSVIDGTGADSDKTTIQLKSGTSATVLKSHQSLSGKQDALVSGTNIKTINNESILGSGNITIQGGGSAYVPTLNAAPTSSTTTYTKDGKTVDFQIGQFCRVAKSGGGGYSFYQLYDLTTSNDVTTATWMQDVHDEIGDIDAVLDAINGEVI